VTARLWPEDHARGWLLRKAADLCEQKHPEACWLAEWAIEEDERHGVAASEGRFREFTGNNPHLFGEDVDRAVAEAYAASERTSCIIGHGAVDSCFHCDPNGQPRWDEYNAAAAALRLAAWIFEEMPENADRGHDVASAVGDGGSWLASEGSYRARLDDLLPWPACGDVIERAVAEVHAADAKAIPPDAQRPVVVKAPASDPIGELLAELDVDERAVAPALAYESGPLKGVLVADFVQCAGNLVRTRTGREPR
jgi:hypothetical protein